jgi:DNA helicase-2/ATP-dependent DNA helicase PcrA
MTSTQTRPIVWSQQQQDFLHWMEKGKGSCTLVAVAGAGKTTTLMEAAIRAHGGVAILAYSRKIADEIKGKLKARGVDFRKVEAGTCHSFGCRAYLKAFPKAKLVEDKVAKIIDARIADHVRIAATAVANLVSLAKQSAIGVLHRLDDFRVWLDLAEHHDIFDELEDDDGNMPVEPMEIVLAAIDALQASIADRATFDYDDMVYMPLILRLRFWRFQIVMIDEAQDTNAARRCLVRALLLPGGRVVAVGDPAQAIFGFTGADADSLDLISKDFNCSRLPLTVSYRCPRSVVAFARQWVGHITAHPDAPEGRVDAIDMEAFVTRYVEPKTLDASMAILCRNTKPLVSLAFRLIARGIACKVEGRAIGEGLMRLAQRWKRVKTTTALRDALEAYLERETTKLLAKGKEQRAQEVEDQVETLRSIIDAVEADGLSTIGEVVARIDFLFEKDVTGVLTLSTIHKSKGREWKTVFWLDRAGTCPSRYARQAWQIEQENNLCYVAATRAQETLIEIPDLSALPLKPVKAAVAA